MQVTPASLEAPVAVANPQAARLMSLDMFRGATIAAMMLVNNPGSWDAAYKPLLHAEWNGWTFTDLIFPFFLWIVGVAIPLSTARRIEQGQGRTQLLIHAVRRAAIIFALGLFLNSFNYLIDGSLFRDGFSAWFHNWATNIRIPGVLQRIAVCYLVASAIFLRSGIRGQVIAIASLLLGYWLLMAWVPVPGHGAASFEKEGNFSQYLDNLVLNGPVIGTHVWKTAKTWDPEGLFSTIPAIASCLFGIMAGHLLRSNQSSETKTAWLFVGGNVLLLTGAVMDHWLPINKSLWTSSYSVFMAGMAMNCFAVCYWLIDVQGWRKWATPFAIYGMNAITVFVLAGISGRLLLEIKLANAASKTVALKTLLYDHLCAPFASPQSAPFLGFLASPKNASLMWALMYVLALYVVAYVMYRRKWFVRF
jgi:predicted acyltransferase